MVFPFAATMLTACNNNDSQHTCTAETEWESDDTHHWHKCTDDDCELILNKAEHEFATTSETPATVDADGEKVETCSTCQKVKRTTLPKLVQTKNEMIAVLESAVREENYTGEIQETYYYEKTSDDSMIAPAETPEKETDYLAKKSDGTFVKYTINHNKPSDFEGDYITDIEYVKAVENDNIHHWLKLSDEETPALFIASETKVGNNTAHIYLGDYGDFDNFAYDCCKKYQATHPNFNKKTTSGSSFSRGSFLLFDIVFSVFCNHSVA
jgi:hypothetical protein